MVSGFKVVCIIKWFCGGTHEVSNIGEVGGDGLSWWYVEIRMLVMQGT